MGFFESIGNWIDSFFDFLVTSSNTDVVETLAALVSITITLQIMFKAYQTFAGKSSEPIRELVWDITIKILVIGVALNLSGYLDLIKLGMQNLHDIMSSNTNLYAQLDEKLNTTVKLIETLWDKVSIFDSTLGYAFSIIGVIIGFFLGIIPTFLIVITTGITLKLLMLVLPIVIYATIYPWFKNIFTQWLSIFVTNLLTVYLIGILLNKFIEKYGDFIAKIDIQVTDGSVTAFAIFTNSIIMGILLLGIMKIAVEIADKIGTASIERLTQEGMAGKGKDGKFAKGTSGDGANRTVTGAIQTVGAMRNFAKRFQK